LDNLTDLNQMGESIPDILKMLHKIQTKSQTKMTLVTVVDSEKLLHPSMYSGINTSWLLVSPNMHTERDPLHQARYQVESMKRGRYVTELAYMQCNKSKTGPGGLLEYSLRDPSEDTESPSVSFQDSPVDPMKGLSFNLSLTDRQKEARAGVELPYLAAQVEESSHVEQQRGQIFFEFDDADFGDEEDPDVDLDI
jgi:hypothetical protein